MHLQCWVAVQEGARGLLIFHYWPPRANEGLHKIGLVNAKGEETRLWREFGECMQEMKPFLPLFRSWHQEAVPGAQADNPDIAISSFIRSFDSERFLVVLNQRIASWDKDSPALPRGQTELHFDEQGLAGLHSVGPLSFHLQVDGEEPAWHILTGKQLLTADDGEYQLTLGAGRAVVLMQGAKESLRRLRKELGLEE